jgi:hypothetical protein
MILERSTFSIVMLQKSFTHCWYLYKRNWPSAGILKHFQLRMCTDVEIVAEEDGIMIIETKRV